MKTQLKKKKNQKCHRNLFWEMKYMANGIQINLRRVVKFDIFYLII